jgi:hypothetical protein
MKMVMAMMVAMKTMAKSPTGLMTKANTQMTTRLLAPQYPELTLLQALHLLWMKRVRNTNSKTNI